jgi:hypothetical protein
VFGEEWTRRVPENDSVRVLEGGKKISGRPEDYFDAELVNRCRTGYVKGWRLLGQVTQKCKDHVREDFLLARLAALLESGALEAKDGYRNLREAELKTPGAAGETVEGEQVQPNDSEQD